MKDGQATEPFEAIDEYNERHRRQHQAGNVYFLHGGRCFYHAQQKQEQEQKQKQNDLFKIELYPKQCECVGMITGKIPVGVEITHLPTGKSVAINLFREQRLNRDLAIQIIEEETNKNEYKNE
jgi:protein subunit release factor B